MLNAHHAPSPFPIGLINPTPPSIFRNLRTVDETEHADFLNLPGLITDGPVTERKTLITVQAHQARVPAYPDCNCDSRFKEVKPHTPFDMDPVFDIPRARKKVIINITRRRWRCKGCKLTVTQPLGFMAEHHYQMTQRLLEYVEVQSLLVTELSLSEETGIFVRKIREIRKGFVERIKKEVKFDAPLVLGLDGVRGDGKRRRVILTDVKGGLVLGLLKSGNKESIAAGIHEVTGWEKIRIVTIDMCKTLLAAVLKALPGVVIIIDLFHIIRTANEAMDKVRVRLFPSDEKKREPGKPLRPRPEPFRMRRADLKQCHLEYMEYWFTQKPELGLAYDLKEDFLELFDEKTYGGRLLMNKAAARSFYEDWLRKFPIGEEHKALCNDFKKIFSPMKNWREEIFNYFEYQYTNAFTESMNRKLKDIIRDARGCKFETLHARIVYGTYLRKRLKDEREAEVTSVIPKKARRQRPNQKGTSAVKCKQEESERPNNYEPPDLRQMAFDFANQVKLAAD